MTTIIILSRLKEIKANLSELEQKLNVKIELNGKKAEISGESYNEYEAERVLNAIDFGFSAKKALILKEENMEFRQINIKKETKRSDLSQVRSRIIGTEGRTKRALASLTGSEIVLQGNIVGIIGPSDTMDEIITALSGLIRGSKQANVYRFLEKMNAAHKTLAE